MSSPESEPPVDPDTVTAKSGPVADPAGLTRTADYAPSAPVSLTHLAFGSTGSNFVSALTPTGTPDTGASGLADYEIVRELGKGGMGVVYEARERATGQVVALKMILDDGKLKMAEVIRFLAEAEAQRTIDHPHVARVFKLGEHAGQPFMVLEILPGGTLADRLKGRTRIPPAAAAGLVAKLARGVHAAHVRGIFHRDLKPANVLFDAAGSPKVADFGLAKRDLTDLTRTGMLMGTPAYMAPEQATGHNERVGAPTDVWALGVILFECLTGERPFAAPPDLPSEQQILVLLKRVATDPPPPPRSVVPEIPRDLERVCLKCLEKDPRDRYPAAAELADDLDRVLAGRPVGVRSATWVEKGLKWARRRPTAAAAWVLAAVAVVLGAFAGTALDLWQRAEGARASAEAAGEEADRQRGKAEDARDELTGANLKLDAARLQAERDRDALRLTNSQLDAARQEADRAREQVVQLNYARNVQVADRLPRSGRTLKEGRALLDACPRALRGWEWDYVHRKYHPDLLTLTAGPRAWIHAVITPGGERLAAAEFNGPVWVWETTTGRVLATLRPPKPPTSSQDVRLAINQDGSVVVTADDREARVWDVAAGAERRVLKLGSRIGAMAVSPDGARLLTAGSDKLVRVWDLTTGDELFARTGHTGPVTVAHFSSNGATVVTAGDDATARIWDAATGGLVAVCKGHTSGVTAAAFSPDGARLVTGGKLAQAWVWDAETGDSVAKLTGHQGTTDVTGVAFDRVGRRVVTAGGLDGAARVWDATTGKQLTVLGEQGADREHWAMAVFSPDGKWVATAGRSGAVRLWPLDGKSQTRWLQGHASPIYAVAFAADSRTLVTASNDGTGRVWDATSPGSLLSLSHGSPSLTTLDGPLRGAVFSRDGLRVATVGGGKVRVWNAATGEPVVGLDGHAWPVRPELFSPDGSQVVALIGRGGGITMVGDDGPPVGWTGAWVVDVATRRVVGRWKAPAGGFRTAGFSPDGLHVLTAGEDGTARLWDATTGAERLVFAGHAGVVAWAEFDRDGQRVATAGEDGTARVWDAATGKELVVFRGHTGPVRGVRFSRDGTRVLTTGTGRDPVRVWDVATGRQLIAVGHSGSASRPHAAFSPDGRWVLGRFHDSATTAWEITPTGAIPMKQTGDRSNTVRVWDGITGNVVATLESDLDIMAWTFVPDGRRVVTADGTQVRVWDPATGVLLLTLEGEKFVTFSPDGRKLATHMPFFERTAWVYDATPVNRDHVPREVAPPPRPVRQ